MKQRINIEGMSCNHCVAHVTDALKEVAGIENVQVNLDDKYALIDLTREVDHEKIKSAIEEVGYKVTGIQEV